MYFQPLDSVYAYRAVFGSYRMRGRYWIRYICIVSDTIRTSRLCLWCGAGIGCVVVGAYFAAWFEGTSSLEVSKPPAAFALQNVYIFGDSSLSKAFVEPSFSDELFVDNGIYFDHVIGIFDGLPLQCPHSFNFE